MSGQTSLWNGEAELGMDGRDEELSFFVTSL